MYRFQEMKGILEGNIKSREKDMVDLKSKKEKLKRDLELVNYDIDMKKKTKEEYELTLKEIIKLEEKLNKE